MGFFPWDEIPDSNVFPTGMYQVSGESLTIVESSTGKKMYKAQLRIEKPETFAGGMFFENFVIGSDMDPQAENTDTWKISFGARRLKSMLKAAQMPQAGSEEEICVNFTGTMFLLAATQYTEQEGDYAGSMRNKINDFYKIGDRAVGDVKQTSAPASVKKAEIPVPPSAVKKDVKTSVVTETRNCGVCGQNVPVKEFASHLDQCIAAQEKAS